MRRSRRAIEWASETPCMDDVYAINVAKSVFRDAYNRGDVEGVLSVYAPEFTDLSATRPSFFGAVARAVLRRHLSDVFAEFKPHLVVTVVDIKIAGNTAADYGWHQLTLTPKQGGNPVITRSRYLEIWQKQADRKWRIAVFIDNAELPARLPPEEG